MDNETQALRVAFEALLPLAAPVRQAAILRAGLKSLLIDDESLRNESATTRLGADVAAAEAAKQQTAVRWPQVREALRARLQERYGTLARGAKTLAQVIGMSESRAVRILCPSSTPPGNRMLTAIEDWLNTSPSGSPPESGASVAPHGAAMPASTSAAPRPDGVSRSQRLKPGTGPQRAPRPQKPDASQARGDQVAPMRGPDARSKKSTSRRKTNRSHPEEASADRHRLTATQREKLAAYLGSSPPSG